MFYFIRNGLDQIYLNIKIFLYKNLNNSFRLFLARKSGAKIGERCRIKSVLLSPESFLIEIGNDVILSQGAKLITHEGSICVFHHENPNLDLFGTVKIGNNCFVGIDCIILPNTVIGDNCVIGAGSVVRGKIPDNSVVIGNPAKVVMTTQDYKRIVYSNPILYEYYLLPPKEKRRILLQRFAALKK